MPLVAPTPSRRKPQDASPRGDSERARELTGDEVDALIAIGA